MSLIDKFLKGFREPDDGETGILFRKSDETVWYRKPDGTEVDLGAGGGGSMPPEAAIYSGDPVAINNVSSGRLTWTEVLGDTELLDLTDPVRPKVLADGVYLVSVWVSGVSMTEGGYFNFDLLLDEDTGAAEIQTESRPAGSGDDAHPSVCCSAGAFIPAEGTITTSLRNNDGVSARDFQIQRATIVRLPT